MDSDDDFEGELEGLDITACKDAIFLLQAEQTRRRESTERMQEKLKAMNYELAARREEAETQRRLLQGEMAQNKSLAAQAAGSQELGKGTVEAIVPAAEVAKYEQESVRHSIELHLDSVAPRRPPCNQLGIRLLDERDLLVEKPLDVQQAEKTLVDTILITHWRSPDSEHKFHLSYRVSRNTTARQLREDACIYWGISEAQYILWTLSSSKVQDDLILQTCFKPNEEAHLILAPKMPKKIEPPERIVDAIRPKVGFKARTVKKKQNLNQNADAQQGHAQPANFYEQMAQAPGLFEFMTQRDRNVKSHLARIRPCSFCIYALLFVQTCLAVAWMKPGNQEYLCRLGVYSALADSEQQFQEIRDEDAAWAWLTYSVPAQLFDNSSSLRSTNYLPGWVRVRTQRAKPASHADCLQQDLPADISCFSELYTESTAEKADLEHVKSYWSDVAGRDGRSNETVPWQFMAEEEAHDQRVETEGGKYQSYDGSGYAVDYHLQYDNMTAVYEAFVADMVALRNASWISKQTRAIHVSFLAYNPNYDYWVSSRYMLELPLNGVAWPSSNVGLFKHVLDRGTTMGKHQLFLDIDRLVFVLLGVLIYQVAWEVVFERKKSGGAWRYLLRSQGLSDLGIIGIYLAIFIGRYFNNFKPWYVGAEMADRVSESYMGMSWQAHAFRQNLVLEAFLLGLVGWRLFAFMKVNRHVFLIWNALNNALSKYTSFLAIFVPVLAGFVGVAHAFWRAHLTDFRTFWSSWTSIVMMMLGEASTIQIGEANRPGTGIYILCLYIVVVLFLVNSWFAVLVQEYQKTRVEAGYRPKDYAWSECNYAEFFLPSALKRVYYKIRPSIVPDDADESFLP